MCQHPYVLRRIFYSRGLCLQKSTEEKESVGSPDADNAVIAALGPEPGDLKFLDLHSRTNLKPGSLIAGNPASETRAIFSFGNFIG